jgi:hypothetical protein
MAERNGVPIEPSSRTEIEEPLGQIRAALTSAEWDAAYQAGRKMTIEDACPRTASMSLG